MRNILIALFFIFTGTLPAQADDLSSIFKLAQENDPAFRAAQEAYLAAQEIKNQSFALFLPALNLSANYTRISQDYSTTGEITYNSRGYNLSLNQMLYHHDYFVQYRQADYQVAQAAANFNSVAQDLIVRVANAYFQVLGAYDNLTFTKSEKKAISEQLNQTKQRFKVGLTAITDVHEAQSRYDQAVAQMIAAENLLAVSRENLREVTGQYPQTLSFLQPEVPLVRPDPQDVDEWARIAGEQSLQLIAAEKAMMIAKEEVNRRRAGHYPTLDLVATRGYSKTDGGVFLAFTGRELTDSRIGVQLNMPIYQGGLVTSQTSEAAHKYAQAKELYEQQRRATERQTRSSYLNVIANISQVLAFKQALKSTRTALEATEAGYEVGTRTAVDVLNSRREVFRAERDYAKSRYTYIIETLRLKKAAGILSENDLLAINKWLQ